MEYMYMKVFHIISIISWYGCLFYLPRLFVYHAENAENRGFCDVVIIQEKKLLFYIGYPAMIASILSGAYLIHLNPDMFHNGTWLHSKLALMIPLIITHILSHKYYNDFRDGKNTKSGKFFRFYNEVPTILLIGIIYFVEIGPMQG